MVKRSLNDEQFILAKKMADFYNQIKFESEQISAHFPLDENQYSRDNLIAYLSLCQQNFQEIKYHLVDVGFSSLEQTYQHVMYSLKRMLNHLEVVLPGSNVLAVPTPACAREISIVRSTELLGKSGIEGQSKVMVTLDPNMLNKEGLMEKLLLNGMNIARINCAHDDQYIWECLIQGVKKAEKRLGKYENETCKIYMDLAGPKIRTGKITEVKKPLKIVVPTDSYGQVIRKVTGYLDYYAEHTTFEAEDFVLAVKAERLFDQIKLNDEFIFTDTRKRKRKLTVIDIISQTCLKVELNKTAYVDENIVIHHKAMKCKVRSILPKSEDIFVTKGDSLRLYLNPNCLGHAASVMAPAGIPVTLSKAFRNVRLRDRIFIDDGEIYGIVKDRTNEYIEVEILSPVNSLAKIKEEKGLNMPDSLISLNVSALTDKDIRDLPFVTKHADIIGVSFVHSPNDLIVVREKLEHHSAGHLAVVAKIETKDAVHQLSKIIIEGLKFKKFGIMIARGDLAVEVGLDHLSTVQEDILTICKAAHIPVIWATGVLEQMTKKGLPARSEITDVAQGTRADCIMLNKGPYIIESVKMLKRLLNAHSDDCKRKEIGSAPFIDQHGFF